MLPLIGEVGLKMIDDSGFDDGFDDPFDDVVGTCSIISIEKKIL